VEKDDERAVLGPGRERVEADAVGGEVKVPDRWPVRTHVGESSHNRCNGHLAFGGARL
jgi:hypothetical protein